MDSIKVDCRSRSYDVIVGHNLDDVLFEVVGEKRVLIVTDNEVRELYEEKMLEVLPHAEIYSIKDGERSKSETALFDLIEFMLKGSYDRRTMLIAFGGGVVSDIVGFVASIYMRGIDYINVPTTLLSQVDACIGGKTGINVNGVKNAVGTFYQPEAVVVDTEYLKTLDEREILSGIGEIIKTAGLNEELFLYVESNIDKLIDMDSEVVKEVVTRCIEIKAEMVSEDEDDNRSIRNKLNLGHTLGNAMESSTRFMSKSHGEYVMRGMYYEAEIVDKIHRIEPEYKQRLQALIEKVLGEKPDFGSIERVVNSAMKDKKNHDGLISIIAPVDFGDVDEILINDEQLIELLEDIVE